jgi:hypothetical protein
MQACYITILLCLLLVLFISQLYNIDEYCCDFYGERHTTLFFKCKQVISLLLLLQVFLPLHIVSADTGPKPIMDFTLKQEISGKPVTITSGTLFECENADCSDAVPLKQLGPQGFSCTASSCSALAYGFSPYHRLEIQFSDDKTRLSNIFKTIQFQSKYKVTIRQDDLKVESLFSLDIFTPLTYVLLCGGCLVGIAILDFLIAPLIKRIIKKK